MIDEDDFAEVVYCFKCEKEIDVPYDVIGNCDPFSTKSFYLCDKYLEERG